MSTPHRKLDHIRIVLDSPVGHKGGTLLGEVELLHRSLPELSLDAVDTGVRFLGRRLSAPIMVAGMTGGHAVAGKINCAIAEAVSSLGLAMGVGSQRAAIEHPELAYTFSIVRKCGGDEIPVVANIGAPQLVKGYGPKEARKAVEMISADAIAVHLNAAQEAFQPEGDTDYRGVLDAVARLQEELDVPVIVKETGHGMSYDDVYALRSRGIRFFDVSGAGGTSWIMVEHYRALESGDEKLAAAALTMRNWGVPTAQAIVEARWAAPDACIIASGGIRTGLDAAKAIALGADMAALALPVVKAYAEGGAKAIEKLLETVIYELKAAMFLSGSPNLAALRMAPLIVSPALERRLHSRGIGLGLYLRAGRSLYLPGTRCNL